MTRDDNADYFQTCEKVIDDVFFQIVWDISDVGFKGGVLWEWGWCRSSGRHGKGGAGRRRGEAFAGGCRVAG